MPRKLTRDYRFKLDAFSPATIPMARLAQYLGDLAQMMGHEDSVHFLKLEPGSTVPVVRVEWEAEPKVRERLRAVSVNEGPAEARRALRLINRRLVEDNADGVLLDPNGAKVLRFPGRSGANQPEYGPFTQAGFFQGIPIRVGGESDPVPIHLEDGEQKHIVHAPRRIAKQIAPYIFSSIVRIEGKGRWLRDKMGDWQMLSFLATDFHLVREGDLRSNIETLRAVPGEWKQGDDPLASMKSLRVGERPH